jgi:hypothetical protein
MSNAEDIRQAFWDVAIISERKDLDIEVRYFLDQAQFVLYEAYRKEKGDK